MNRVRQVVLIIALTTLTGCSFRTEVDYSRDVTSAPRMSSVPLTGNHDEYKSSFHFEVEGRIDDARSPETHPIESERPAEVKAVPTVPNELAMTSPQIIVMQSGPTINITNNFHIGDMSTHVHISTQSFTEMPERPVRIQAATVSSQRNSERCEKLRRHHEATIRKWQELFQ